MRESLTLKERFFSTVISSVFCSVVSGIGIFIVRQARLYLEFLEGGIGFVSILALLGFFVGFYFADVIELPPKRAIRIFIGIAMCFAVFVFVVMIMVDYTVTLVYVRLSRLATMAVSTFALYSYIRVAFGYFIGLLVWLACWWIAIRAIYFVPEAIMDVVPTKKRGTPPLNQPIPRTAPKTSEKLSGEIGYYLRKDINANNNLFVSQNRKKIYSEIIGENTSEQPPNANSINSLLRDRLSYVSERIPMLEMRYEKLKLISLNIFGDGRTYDKFVAPVDSLLKNLYKAGHELLLKSREFESMDYDKLINDYKASNRQKEANEYEPILQSYVEYAIKTSTAYDKALLKFDKLILEISQLRETDVDKILEMVRELEGLLEDTKHYK
ncbi:MAG: hypothetical protein FWB80_07475 [Defluviitaleaceae bacterium]|nr:hypothetical protein [Defluviitaleaceae bacterium]